MLLADSLQHTRRAPSVYVTCGAGTLLLCNAIHLFDAARKSMSRRAIEACRLTTQTMTPVLYLSDGYIANGAEPWKIPAVDSLPAFEVEYAKEGEDFQPYGRDENLARSWAIPGTPGLQHRLGGLEKQDGTGNVSYDPENHQRMTEIRAEKVAKVAEIIPEADIFGGDSPIFQVRFDSQRNQKCCLFITKELDKTHI